MLAGFTTIAVAVLASAHLNAPFDPHAPFAAGGEIGGILFSAALAFAYSIGWTPCASDYARYLPSNSSARAVGLWAFAGDFVASLSLEMLGAAAATAVRGPGIAAQHRPKPSDCSPAATARSRSSVCSPCSSVR
jgi:purine-cytosine permease-like protein